MLRAFAAAFFAPHRRLHQVVMQGVDFTPKSAYIERRPALKIAHGIGHRPGRLPVGDSSTVEQRTLTPLI